jgi:hypothetical protein
MVRWGFSVFGLLVAVYPIHRLRIVHIPYVGTEFPLLLFGAFGLLSAMALYTLIERSYEAFENTEIEKRVAFEVAATKQKMDTQLQSMGHAVRLLEDATVDRRQTIQRIKNAHGSLVKATSEIGTHPN